MTDHASDAFAIFGWREANGTVHIVATDRLVRASESVVNVETASPVVVQSGPYRGEHARLRLIDRKVHFTVEGYAEEGETDIHASFVPPLLKLLERWLPREADSTIDVDELHPAVASTTFDPVFADGDDPEEG